MHAEAWVALAQWATVAVAAVAAYFALRQANEARKTRERVAQPDVVVYIDHNPENWQWMDLVIKNFGQTTAYNIRLTLPPLKMAPYMNAVTGEQVTEVYVPEHIAVLAPGQQWRTLWDSLIERENPQGELPSQFVGYVQFDAMMVTDKPPYQNPIALDTNVFRDMMRFSEDETSKDIAQNIADVASALQSYHKEHDGIWVYTVPGDQERQYLQQRRARSKAMHDEITRQLHGGNPQPKVDND